MENKNLDHYLVTQFKLGEHTAFNLMVSRYQHKILKLVTRYTKDPVSALDVTQETFIRAYRALPNFKESSTFYTWLFRIAINTAKNYEISKSHRPPDVDIDFEEAEHLEKFEYIHSIANPENNVHCDELRSAMKETLQKLPEDMQEAIFLREIEGLSYEEIAETMNCPLGTVRSRISRARQTLDALIKEMTQS